MSSLAPQPGPGAGSPGRTVGPYQLLEELGRGGMGRVFRAWDPRLQREVALKVLLAGEGAGPVQLQRFQNEALAAARLRHPHIVSVYDAGVHQGAPYLVMDLVEGEPLSALLSQQGPWPPRDAAGVTLKLARAVGYAHAQFVLHRDLKPGNVLLGRDGEPHVTDFGLARDLEATGARLTRSGHFLGTAGYAAPEQLLGQLDRVDQRADVYGLGATLYTLLSGRAPFEECSSPLEIGARALQGPPSSLRRVGVAVDRDLETICLHCLEPLPEQRYASAGELADDLERWLSGVPIRARPHGRAELARRWLARRPRLVAGCLLGLGLGLTLWAAKTRETLSALAQAEQERRRAEEALDDARLARDQARASLAEAQAARAEAERERAAALVATGRARLEQAYALLRDERAADAARAFAQAATHLVQEDPALHAAAERGAREALAQVGLLLRGRLPLPATFAVAQAGEQLLAAGVSPSVQVLPLRPEANPAAEQLLLATHPVTGLEVAPDGRQLALSSISGELTLTSLPPGRLRSLALPKRPPPRDPSDPLRGAITMQRQALAWSRDGRRLLVAALAAAYLVDVAEGTVLATFAHGEVVRWACFDPAERRVATFGRDGRVVLWSLEGAREAELALGGPLLFGALLDPDTLLVVESSGLVSRRDLSGATPPRELSRGQPWTAAALDRDEDRLALGTSSGRVEVLDLRGGWPLWRLRAAHPEVAALAFLSGDRLAIASGGEAEVRALPRRTHATAVPADPRFPLELRPFPGGVCWRTREGLHLWRLEGQALETVPTAGPDSGWAVSPDGALLAMAGPRGGLAVGELGRGGRLVGRFDHPVSAAAFEPGGSGLLAAVIDPRRPDGGLSVVRLPLGAGESDAAQSPPPSPHQAPIVTLLPAPTLPHLASVDLQGGLALWELGPDGAPTRSHSLLAGRGPGAGAGPPERIAGLGFSESGWLVAASQSGWLRAWDPTDPTAPPCWSVRRDGAIRHAALEPGGQRLAVCAGSGELELWDVGTGRLLRTLRGPAPVQSSAWLGRDTLVTAEEPGALRVWQLDPAPLAEFATAPEAAVARALGEAAD